MAKLQSGSFRRPDEVHALDLGRIDIVNLGEESVGRQVLEPGWRWSEHVKPVVGTPLAVHLASRLLTLAGPGEILPSATTRDLVDGSGLAFEDRGRHELKGITGSREVFALTEA